MNSGQVARNAARASSSRSCRSRLVTPSMSATSAPSRILGREATDIGSASHFNSGMTSDSSDLLAALSSPLALPGCVCLTDLSLSSPRHINGGTSSPCARRRLRPAARVFSRSRFTPLGPARRCGSRGGRTSSGCGVPVRGTGTGRHGDRATGPLAVVEIVLAQESDPRSGSRQRRDHLPQWPQRAGPPDRSPPTS